MQMPEILIIEDEPSIAAVVELSLRRAGYQIKTVRDGNAALKTLESHLPDLLVLDVMLPGVDGFSSCAGFGSVVTRRSFSSLPGARK